MRTASEYATMDFDTAYEQWNLGYIKLQRHNNSPADDESRFKYIKIKKIHSDLYEPLKKMEMAVKNSHTVLAMQWQLIVSTYLTNLALVDELYDFLAVCRKSKFELKNNNNPSQVKINECLDELITLTRAFKKNIIGLFGSGSSECSELMQSKIIFNAALETYRTGYKTLIIKLDSIEVDNEFLIDSLRNVFNQVYNMYIHTTGANKTIAQTIRFFGRQIECLEAMPLNYLTDVYVPPNPAR